MKLFFVALGCLSLNACLSTTVHFPSRGKMIKKYDETQSFFLWGLAPSRIDLQSSEVCPQGDVKKFQTITTGMNGFLSFITIGIYSPKTARVWCSK